MIKFSVAANCDNNLIDKIDRSRVAELFGKLTADVTGGGRASAALPRITGRNLRNQIKKTREYGIEYNYLLNSSCLNNTEWTSAGQKKIRFLLDWLTEAGVTSVTVSVPYLLEMIKKRYPGLQVSISVQAGVDSPERAEYWEDLGADQITLSFVDINRNFEKLRAVRNKVSCRLQLIANLMCLQGCPFYKYHSNINAHASQKKHSSKYFLIDYCFLKCSHMKLKEPVRMIRSGWIRPEDVKYYADIGIDRIKLVDRAMSTEDIARVVGAYTSEKYEGNLLDLFSSPNRNVSAYRSRMFNRLKYFLKPRKVNIFRFLSARNLFEKNPVYIDNGKLNGFIEHFFHGRCSGSECDECGYCKETADRALYIPEDYRERVLKKYEMFIESLNDGSMFLYK